MFSRLTPLVALAVLSGCATTDEKPYHQETLAAISAQEASLNNKLENIALQLSNQSDYIESLESQVLVLGGEVGELKKHVNTPSKAQTTPKAPTQKIVKVDPSNRIVLGEIETVTIDNVSQRFDARVDTGAATSSLNAVDIAEFERNGKNWVRFHLSDGVTELNDDNWIEAPVVRHVKIRQSTNEEPERRVVVELWVKLGKIHEKAQFTLADRSQMSHPVLLGREFIRDIAVVDVSKKYIHTEVAKK
ncbi:ATP-dependent zinc protease [Vibrio cholerae]